MWTVLQKQVNILFCLLGIFEPYNILMLKCLKNLKLFTDSFNDVICVTKLHLYRLLVNGLACVYDFLGLVLV